MPILLARWVLLPTIVWFGGNYVARKAMDSAMQTAQTAGATAQAVEASALQSVRAVLGPIAVGLLVYSVVMDKK